MKPVEYTRNPRQMNDAQRLHHYGRLRPMPQPSWFERLIERLRR